MSNPLHEEKETYLGDGLYASFDGWMITLRAPRENGDHWIGLEPEILVNLMRWLKTLPIRTAVE